MSPRVECSKTLSISGLVQTLTAVLTCAASVVAILNKLTPTFAGLLDFRVRYIILLLVLCSLSGLGSWIFFARHECPSSIAHLLVQHRTYAKGDRILGGFVSIVSILAIVVASSDFKYWKGREGPLQGRVLDKNGDPVSGVQVDALNVDKISVAMVPETTDSYDGLSWRFSPLMECQFTLN